jgi:hypothetical protein
MEGADYIIDLKHRGISLTDTGTLKIEQKVKAQGRIPEDATLYDPEFTELAHYLDNAVKAEYLFKRDKDTGKLRKGVQVQRGTPGSDPDGFFEFNPRQVRYIPFHPDVENPYGRAPFLPALAAIFFKIEVLNDIKAVIHNQGYPRLDVSVVEEVVLKNMPKYLDEPGQEQAKRDYLMDFLVDIQQSYMQLEPDDTFIHWDSIDVDSVDGASGSINVDGLMKVLDTQIVAGLKHLPVLLGRNDSATTTHATIQWRIFALLVTGIQRVAKRAIEWAHTTALQIKGFQARSEVEFEALPTTDRVAEAQAFAQEVQAWGTAVDRGWTTDDNAAQALFHHDAIGEKKPDVALLTVDSSQEPEDDDDDIEQDEDTQTGQNARQIARGRAPQGTRAAKRRRITSDDLAQMLNDPAIIQHAKAILAAAREQE